jgi:hypothetical protein
MIYRIAQFQTIRAEWKRILACRTALVGMRLLKATQNRIPYEPQRQSDADAPAEATCVVGRLQKLYLRTLDA